MYLTSCLECLSMTFDMLSLCYQGFTLFYQGFTLCYQGFTSCYQGLYLSIIAVMIRFTLPPVCIAHRFSERVSPTALCDFCTALEFHFGKNKVSCNAKPNLEEKKNEAISRLKVYLKNDEIKKFIETFSNIEFDKDLTQKIIEFKHEIDMKKMVKSIVQDMGIENYYETHIKNDAIVRLLKERRRKCNLENEFISMLKTRIKILIVEKFPIPNLFGKIYPYLSQMGQIHILDVLLRFSDELDHLNQLKSILNCGKIKPNRDFIFPANISEFTQTLNSCIQTISQQIENILNIRSIVEDDMAEERQEKEVVKKELPEIPSTVEDKEEAAGSQVSCTTKGSMPLREFLCHDDLRNMLIRFLDDSDVELFVAFCCKRGDVLGLQSILSRRLFNVNMNVTETETALTLSAQHGQFSCILALIRADADVDKPNKDGWTPLMKACSNGHDQCVQVLLENNATVDTKTITGETALTLAQKRNNDLCINMLEQNRVLSASVLGKRHR